MEDDLQATVIPTNIPPAAAVTITRISTHFSLVAVQS